MNLQKAASGLFGKSLTFYKSSLACIVLLYALTVISFVIHDPWSDAVLLIAVLTLQVAQTLIKYRAITWYGRGEQARRMDQIEEAFGTLPNALLVQRLRAFVGLCDVEKAKDYWFTTVPKGPRRLVGMIEEASFYTATYAETCWNYFKGFAIFGVVFCVIFLTIAMRVGVSKSKEEFWSHFLVASLSIFVAGDIVGLALQYKDLAEAASNALESASELANRTDVTAEQSLELAMEYNTALAQAPPLPNFLHKRRRDTLGAHWKAYAADQIRTMGT